MDLASGARKKERDAEAKERALREGLEKDEKYKTRGRNSALRKFIRKKGGKNVRDERREKLERLKLERAERNRGVKKVVMGAALDRFAGPRKRT